MEEASVSSFLFYFFWVPLVAVFPDRVSFPPLCDGKKRGPRRQLQGGRERERQT